MSSPERLGWAAIPAALVLIGSTILPSGFTFTDPSAFATRQFGVEVGMTATQARQAILRDRRFRYTGTQPCATSCADATGIDRYTARGLMADGWVDLGIRDDRVVYIFAEKGARI